MYHFVGIKGAGMSSLAQIMKKLGYDVQGSDIDKHFFTEQGLIENNINKYPLFLVHDSVVFDSTDKGYVAKFLNMVYESTKKYKYQYICCLNDDQIIYSDICEELRNLYNNSQKLSQKDTLFGISFGDR